MTSFAPLVILCTLTSGFLFLRLWNYTNYSLWRSGGQRFYIKCALYGLPFATFALYLVYELTPWLSSPDNSFKIILFLIFTHSSAFLVSLFLTILTSTHKARMKAFRSDDMEMLVYMAHRAQKPILISLSNRKVFMGLVIDTLGPGPSSFLTILPFASGYRDSEQLRLSLDAYYYDVIRAYGAIFDKKKKGVTNAEKVELAKMSDQRCIVVPRSEIVVMYRYEHELYEETRRQYLESPPPTSEAQPENDENN